MEHEKRVAKALGISDYTQGGRTHRCILRVCADVSLDSTDEDIVKTTKELPLLLRRAIETARRSCSEADSGVMIEESSSDAESDSDSGSSSTSDEESSSSEEEVKLEGGSIGWPWKAKKAVMSKSEALKRQIESFYTGRLNSELNAAHARAEEYINKHHSNSKHLERAQHALSKERDNIRMRHGDDWHQFHATAHDNMHKMIGEGTTLRAGESGEDWKNPLFDEMRRLRTTALNATHEYVNEQAPKWKSEMMRHGERALEIMKTM